MKTKHTPGPWYNHGADGLFDERTHGPSIQDAKGNVICAAETVDADAPDELNDERLANAHLIAAAPEMLDALLRIVEINGSTGGAESLVKEFKHIAKQAIAKAKGE